MLDVWERVAATIPALTPLVIAAGVGIKWLVERRKRAVPPAKVSVETAGAATPLHPWIAKRFLELERRERLLMVALVKAGIDPEVVLMKEDSDDGKA